MTNHCDRWQRNETDGRDSATRASDGERDDVVQTLIRHHVDGRLTTAEFEERTDRALGSRTRGDLAAILSDLPRPVADARGAAVSRRFLAALLVTVAIAAIVASRGRAAFGLLWVVAIVSFVRIRGARRSWGRPTTPSRAR